MRRSHLLLPVLGALALAGCSADRTETTAPLAAPGAVSRSVGETSGRYILASNGGFSKDLAARVTALGGTLESVHAGAGIAVVSGISDAAASSLSSIGGVNDVEADAVISLDAPLASVSADASAVGDPSVASVTKPSHAVLYSYQWNMRDIGADKAWAANKLGGSDVTVAIIDTGIDYDALDLSGLVDLNRSASFVPTDDAITGKYLPGRNAISDLNGHGTNVATQVSSKAVAFAGVTSKTTLIGVKVLGANGRGSLSAILNGVLWAADHGADVANMSLGGGFAKAGNGRFVGLINKTFNYAKQKGMLIVVAAGNDGADLDHDGNFHADFCNEPQVMCVSAVGPATGTGFGVQTAMDTPAFFTNFGRSAISVAAPGGNAQFVNGQLVVSAWPWGKDIASWVWSLCSRTVAAVDGQGNIVFPYAGHNYICGDIGTSQATPHVTGLAALLVAERGRGQPSAIRNAIQNSADDLGQPGTDPYYGRGRINVAKALGLQ